MEGVGHDWLEHIEAYARHYANEDRVPQVVWFCPTVDVYGRTPMPEFNSARGTRFRGVRIVKTVQPERAT